MNLYSHLYVRLSTQRDWLSLLPMLIHESQQLEAADGSPVHASEGILRYSSRGQADPGVPVGPPSILLGDRYHSRRCDETPTSDRPRIEIQRAEKCDAVYAARYGKPLRLEREASLRGLDSFHEQRAHTTENQDSMFAFLSRRVIKTEEQTSITCHTALLRLRSLIMSIS